MPVYAGLGRSAPPVPGRRVHAPMGALRRRAVAYYSSLQILLFTTRVIQGDTREYRLLHYAQLADLPRSCKSDSGASGTSLHGLIFFVGSI